MASDVIARRRALLEEVPRRPWQLDIREAPALDADTVLVRDAAGVSIAVITFGVSVGELVIDAVNEYEALLAVEASLRGTHTDPVLGGMGGCKACAALALLDEVRRG